MIAAIHGGTVGEEGQQRGVEALQLRHTPVAATVAAALLRITGGIVSNGVMSIFRHENVIRPRKKKETLQTFFVICECHRRRCSRQLVNVL